MKYEKNTCQQVYLDGKNDRGRKRRPPDGSRFAVRSESRGKCIARHLDKEINYLPHSE